jgi:hypothetical protein
MTPKEYNAMPEGDTKLAARCAVTCGWQHVKAFGKHEIRVAYDDNFVHQGVRLISWLRFDPFTDTSIPYGLIGRGVAGVRKSLFSGYYAWVGGDVCRAESKTHAIINAYCAADPLGHWARFTKDAE